MALQILTLKLDGITAGDYLRWCRDPDPPALDFGLRSISIDADPLGDTITASLDWNQPLPTAPAAATAAGLPLSAGVQIQPLPTDGSHARPVSTEAHCVVRRRERVGCVGRVEGGLGGPLKVAG
jgi:hypothetical protein